MILHNKPKSYLKVLFPLLLLVIFLVPKQKKFYSNLKVSTLDKLSTFDSGLSYFI